jgi:hypothetical protein
MPVYVIGSTDPDNLDNIHINLCPYYGRENATVNVQLVSTVANFEILNDDDYILFREYVGGFDEFVEVARNADSLTVTVKDGVSNGMMLSNGIFNIQVFYPDELRIGGFYWTCADGKIKCTDTNNPPETEYLKITMLQSKVFNAPTYLKVAVLAE